MKIKRYVRSSTMKYGHAQVIAGMIVTALAYFNPISFPNIPVHWFGLAGMAGGVLTYYFRIKTRKPLDDYDKTAEEKLK